MKDDNLNVGIFFNEENAVEAFKKYRLSEGVVCKKCGGTKHYWLSSKQQFQCSACRFRTTLRSGSVLEASKLPLYYFFIAAYLYKEQGTKMAIDEFQRVTSHKYYEPIWDFIKRLKNYFDDYKCDKLLSLYYSEYSKKKESHDKIYSFINLSSVDQYVRK